MAEKVLKRRDVAIDFVKVIATLLVMNSHMHICYENHYDLATGGGIGDALFFFVSGFTLFCGRKTDFINWYKRRIGRIYPTVIAVGLLACTIFGQEQSFTDVMFAKKYWFLQCILICYILLYPVIRYKWNIKVCWGGSIVVMLVAFFFCYDFSNTLFYGEDNYFRWILFFTIMLVGGEVCMKSNAIKYHWWNLIGFFCCVLLWYGVNYITGGTEWTILSYIPLVCICYFAYGIGKSPLIDKLYKTKICGNLLFIIGNLCLENYLIQKYIITDSLNSLFPLNIPIIMIAVLVSAYILHILSSFVSQIFDSKPFSWKELFLYKK